MKPLVVAALIVLETNAMAATLPVPPVPPENQQLAQAAPVPDRDAQAPVGPDPDKTTVDVRLYRARTYDSSAGFVPGSRYQSSEDRKPIQTPGFTVHVPLE